MAKIMNILKNIFTGYDVQDAYHQGDIALNEQHLMVIQNLKFTWLNIESGAIAAYFPNFDSVAHALKLSRNSNELRKIMSEALCAFPLWLSRSNCNAGEYLCENNQKESFLFQLTEQHIKLIHHLIWRDMVINDGIVQFYFQGYPLPMPYTDGKRPFGDRTDYHQDMIDILGGGVELDLEKLFREMDMALYVYVRNTIQ